ATGSSRKSTGGEWSRERTRPSSEAQPPRAKARHPSPAKLERRGATSHRSNNDGRSTSAGGGHAARARRLRARREARARRPRPGPRRGHLPHGRRRGLGRRRARRRARRGGLRGRRLRDEFRRRGSARRPRRQPGRSLADGEPRRPRGGAHMKTIAVVVAGAAQAGEALRAAVVVVREIALPPDERSLRAVTTLRGLGHRVDGTFADVEDADVVEWWT